MFLSVTDPVARGWRVGLWWADPVGALAMLPIILWQGWETLAEARERADRKD
jgi:divalent metal cation (Fe/Co/Zn/Cd) transporter